MTSKKIFLSLFVFFLLSWLLWWFMSYVFFGENEKSLNRNSQSQKQVISINDLENNITELVDETSPSVVSVVIKKDLPQYLANPFWFFAREVGSVSTEVGWWTGFFVDNEWTIITNKHVVEDTQATYSVVLSDGESYDARVLALDPVNDLAIIKIDKDTIPLTIIWKDSDVKIGQFVIANGNALSEFQNSVSFGVVSGKNRIIEAQWQKLSSLIQTDTAINPWNSWGPLINMAGEVIGINTAIASGQWLGFSIQLSKEKIDYMLDSIETYWEIKKPFIGIYYIPINEAIAQELEVTNEYWIYIPDDTESVIEGSSAANAWIEPWDIILEVDGEMITQDNSLDVILQNKFPWEILELVIYRDWLERDIELVLGENI